MDELSQDLSRLSFMADHPEGLEAFSLTVRLNDFVRYYFSRFLRNLTHLLKAFSHSEISAYNERYKRQLEMTFKDPLLRLDRLLVSIPQGMQADYNDTVELFKTLLEQLSAKSLKAELEQLIEMLGEPGTVISSVDHTVNLDATQKTLEHAFSPHGLIVLPAPQALESLSSAARTNDQLLALTKEHYPEVIALQATVEKFERHHQTLTLTQEQKHQLQNVLLQLGRRLTLFAAIMEKLQVTEHAFVRALETLRKHSARIG